jgi:hypothetical protein
MGRGVEEMITRFVIKLDHPLPRPGSLWDMSYEVNFGDHIYVIGRFISVEEFVNPMGSTFFAPVIEGLVISRRDDRNFLSPVWISEDIFSYIER